MKKPTYFTKKEIEIDDTKYAKGTQIQPIWNEGFLPEHLMDRLKEVSRYGFQTCKLVMCSIGKDWYPIPENEIEERY